MKTISKIVSVLVFAFITTEANAQWNWGDQVDVAKEKNVIYTDAYKAKNYDVAVEPLNWLLTNTPDLNPSIYINGVEIYKNLAKSETDPVVKDQHVQKALELHDTRIKYFEGEAKIMDRKSLFAYTFYKKTKEKYPYLYDLYSKTFELNGANMNSGNLVAYMNVIYKYRFAGGEMSDEEVINKYSEISEALNTQKGRVASDKKAKYDKMLGQVDKLLTATKVEISCEFVETKLGPKMVDDVNMAKKVFDLMIKGKCIDRPLALEAAEMIQNSEPTYGVAKFLATKNNIEGNTDVAIKYYEEAAGLTDDNAEKADMYVSIAKMQSKKGQKSTARNSARRALSFDPSYSDAYKLIGDLYMQSFDDCKQEKSQVDDRAIFIAAYEQYKKAGNTTGMNNAKAQFPSISDIFNDTKEEGQSITIGCWINTTVILERRPN
ncbi:MAG: tetratricopeptide repeat protein [Ekhidna sp.]